MAVSTDYTGRTVDLSIFEGSAPTGNQLIRLGFTGDGGNVIAGIQKLTQSYTLLFLTERGSIPQKLDQGTDFVIRMRQGRIQQESDVLSEFTLANELVREQLTLAASGQNYPDDEVFDSAILDSFELDRDLSRVLLRVRVRSIAGETRDVLLPVPVAIQ
jgi:hypothetical protein